MRAGKLDICPLLKSMVLAILFLFISINYRSALLNRDCNQNHITIYEVCDYRREKMEVERESVKLSVSNDLIKTAHFLSMEAHKQNQPYFTGTNKHGTASSSSSTEVSIFAFPGSWEVNDWYQDDLFGETDVDCNLFPSLRRVGENRLAKVNAAFLQRFQDLLNNSALKTEVEKAVIEDEKEIVFTGHSSGGAIASFATLWMLDEYVKKRGKRFPIRCVTFGSPLIGDRIMSHAVRHEKWASHFTHFVMKHDIVPRIMLAPKISIQQPLPNILKFFQQKVNPTSQTSHNVLNSLEKLTLGSTMDQDISIEGDEGIAFFKSVMIKASTVASHVAFQLMEATNSLIQNLMVDVVKVSPYRPSGYYVFCTRPKQFVVENPSAVLQLLYYLLQLTDEDQNLADYSVNSVAESLSYGQVQSENLVDLKELIDHLLTPNDTAGDAIRTRNKALTASARWCLMAAEESEKRKKENEKLIKMSLRKKQERRDTISTMEGLLDVIREYKIKNLDYYEAFKLQDGYEDFMANMDRLKLAKMWDEIVEMVKRDDLPDEFEGWEEWVVVGTEFRRLVEPLDIANYYRQLKGDGYMTYMDVRPERYKFTQRWYEHANGTGFELVSESNFVAEVEEMNKEVEEFQNKTVEEVREEIESVEERVKKWLSDGNIRNEDVYWGESLLSMLRGKLP